MTQNQRYNSQRRAVLLDPTPAAVDKGRGGRLKDANVLLKHSNKNRELNTIVCVWGGVGWEDNHGNGQTVSLCPL